MKPSVSAIVSRVCALFDVEIDAVLGKGRREDIILARHVAWWAVRKRLGLTYPAMAAEFDVDHTTIQNGLRSIAKKFEDPERYPMLVENVSTLVQQMATETPAILNQQGNPFWRRPVTPVTGDEAPPLKLVRGGRR